MFRTVYGECPRGAWSPTPWWHPARWVGFDVRCWETGHGYFHDEPGWWVYGRSKVVARKLLHLEHGQRSAD